MIKFFLINVFQGSILGPCETKEECEQQYLLLENPKEWILVRTI